jgi:transcriptional regulator
LADLNRQGAWRSGNRYALPTSPHPPRRLSELKDKRATLTPHWYKRSGNPHGYGILLRIQQISGERLEILQGSFYTAIYRLERRGWIKGEWGESENNRRARFYSLTAAGTRQLKAETAKWTDMAAVVAGILDKKADEI